MDLTNIVLEDLIKDLIEILINRVLLMLLNQVLKNKKDEKRKICQIFQNIECQKKYSVVNLFPILIDHNLDNLHS